MLKNINPLLNGELLLALDKMGHGDTIAIVDGNFPADSCSNNLHIALTGNNCSDTLEAILSVLPLDSFTDKPIGIMVPEEGAEPPEVAHDFHKIINNSEEQGHEVEWVPRMDFYKLAQKARVIVSTSDQRAYACLTLVKGVIF